MKSLLAVVLAQISIPAWLVPYPETTPQVKNFQTYTEISYTTAASTNNVIEHYKKLFDGAGLQFVANSDGLGANVRASAPECDLLLSIRQQSAGTTVKLSCAAKSPSYGSEISPTTVMQQRHNRLVAEMGIHPVYQDAPAPPLVWPDWLVNLNGGRLATQRGVDQSHRPYLESRFKSTAPMTKIFTFYEDLLKANEYSVYSSKLGTGHTMSGIQQNADGYVEGANYPNGHPGPRTVIRVDFSRFYLNEPISVRVRFTTYSFEAPKR